MTTIKYDIPMLDWNIKFSLWQVKLRVILAQMDLDDALLGFDKMPSSWTKEEKQRKDRKALSNIYSSSPIKSNSTRRFEGKKRLLFYGFMHDEKPTK